MTRKAGLALPPPQTEKQARKHSTRRTHTHTISHPHTLRVPECFARLWSLEVADAVGHRLFASSPHHPQGHQA